MSKSLTILFPTMDGLGPINSAIGVAEVLQRKGHRIIFAINEQWRGKLSAYGFEEELIVEPGSDPNVDQAKKFAEMVNKMEPMLKLPPLNKMEMKFSKIFPNHISRSKALDAIMKDVLSKCKPDVIVVENFIIHPSLISSGIPWVLMWSGNPLMLLNDDRLPPHGFGLSINANKDEWDYYRSKLNTIIKPTVDIYNEWLVEYGINKIPENIAFYKSPYLNIYDYPREIDYLYDKSMPENVHRFDNFMRSEKNAEFEVPEDFLNRSGKLVYFSLGTVGSANVNIMKRLVSILSKSEHKFIVSKGQLHDQYELADNMWGQKYLPQTKILPLVNLFLTHGGNNSLTEAFYFGKPMIAFPLFGDQFDNAQRIQDTGYGIRLDPINCTETELLGAIDTLINDNDLKARMESVSKRIQASNNLMNVADVIEALV